MARKSLEQMIQETYDDPELQQAALEEVQIAGTQRDIERGKLVLPHPIELKRHLLRKAEQEQRADESER